MRIIVFIATIDFLLTLTTYAYLRSVFGWAKGWAFALVYVLLSINIAVNYLLPDTLPLPVLQAEAYLSGLWLGILYYIWLVAVLHTLLKAVGYFCGWQISHITVATAMLGVCGILCLWGMWNAFHPCVRNEEIVTDKLAQDKNLKIAMVSDVHLGRVLSRSFAERVVALLNSVHPDMVVVAGDLLNEKIGDVEKAGALEPFGKVQAPLGIYMAMGNHDYFDNPGKWWLLLKLQGINVLHGASKVVADGTVKVTGLVDFSHDRGSDGLKRLAAENEKFYSIVIDHQPRRFAAAEAAGYDLYLAGHTHTGQMFPNRLVTGMMYELDYGRREFGKMTGIVSCGIGFWGPPIRTGTLPEIVVIDIKGNKILTGKK